MDITNFVSFFRCNSTTSFAVLFCPLYNKHLNKKKSVAILIIYLYFEVVNIPIIIWGLLCNTERNFFGNSYMVHYLYYISYILLWNLFFYKKADKEEWNKDRLLFLEKGEKILRFFQTAKVKTPCTVGWLHPNIFIPKRDYTVKEKELASQT